MKFSLCIEPVFRDVDFYDRVRLAKDCGVDAIELWDASEYDFKKIGAEALKHGIPVAAISIWKSWQYRMNDAYPAVLKTVDETIKIGKDIGCSTFIGLAGELECKADSQKSLLIENLKRVAQVCEKHDVTVVIEPLNSLYDHKGYYLDSSYIGFEIVKSVNSTHIKLLYDCYHMQLMEGNIINSIKNNIEFIGHFHSAGVPGRHELHIGETNYPFVIKAIKEAGYDRYFGFEYWPTYDDEQSVRDVLTYVKTGC